MAYTRRLLTGVGIAGVGIVTGIVVAAQGLVMQRNLSLAMAKSIAEATLAECKSKGFSTAAAVVDRAGQVLVILRDEQATAQTAEMARRKAYTARMFRTSTPITASTATRPSPFWRASRATAASWSRATTAPASRPISSRWRRG